MGRPGKAASTTSRQIRIPLRILYSALLYLALPYIALHLALRGFRNRAYWRRWGERFAYLPPGIRGPYAVWVHAVSVGEVQAAIPMLRQFRMQDPSMRILLTTTTPTGSDLAQGAISELVDHVYAPYDLPGVVGRFLERIRPRAVVVMETELWPNTFASCHSLRIPIVVANARLSARSARRYRWGGPIVREMLENVTAIAAQHQLDADRFVALGAPESHVHVTGSIKFDVHVPASFREQGQALRRCLGVGRSVWIAASTHEGEEEIVLDAFARLRKSLPESVLVLVPRHPERFAGVAALARRRGFRIVLRSEAPESCLDADIFLGDTMGELPLFYAASDMAFVGGSLVPVGGHNMLEPAALEIPVVLGPYLFNFAEISRMMLERGAARQVRNALSLADTALELLRDANLRHNMGQKGKRVVDENRGALDRLMKLLERFVPGKVKGERLKAK